MSTDMNFKAESDYNYNRSEHSQQIANNKTKSSMTLE